MLIAEKILGNLKDKQEASIEAIIDYVDIDWHEIHKKIHRKFTNKGEEIGMRFGDDILVHGLKQDDILFESKEKIIAVNILPCDALVIEIPSTYLVAKVCYEIGNKHAPLFRGTTDTEFIIPYDKPLEVLLEKLDIKVVHQPIKLDFTKAISTSLGGHHH